MDKYYKQLLEGIGEDVNRAGLKGTPKRAAEAFRYLTQGYKQKIEDVINDVDGVLESAVFGIPHADFGESVLAAIVLDNTSLTDAAIAAQVEPHLARFKHPRRYIIMDALPRNTMGKVQKNILRAEFGD